MLITLVNQKSVIFVTISVYFLDKKFKFQPGVCNGCHDVLMMSMNILNIYGADYCYIISGISKNQVISLMESIDLTDNLW